MGGRDSDSCFVADFRCSENENPSLSLPQDATNVRKTREVLRFLEQCASRLMLEDIRMHQKKTEVLGRSITKSKNYLKANMSNRDFTRLEKLVDAHFKEMFDFVRKRQRSDFARLQQVCVRFIHSHISLDILDDSIKARQTSSELSISIFCAKMRLSFP